MERLTGAQIVCESLVKEGVEVIFGIPGGAVIPLYDALFRYPLRHVLARHEQGAVFAADGYARASGRVGVCFATSGPGATNLVTGIAAANMDSSSMVVFTGQVPRDMIGRDAFQETDIIGIVTPVTKWRDQVRELGELARTIKKAFYLAWTGRPGPVLIDIPVDVQRGKTEFDYPTCDPVIRGYIPQGMESKGRLGLMERQVDKAVIEIEKSQRPVIIAGRGVVISGAYSELLQLAEQIHTPVASTLHGLSGFPQDHPLALGMLGMFSPGLANRAIEEADLLLAVGARFDDRATSIGDKFAPKAKVIHIDIDPAEIGKNVRTDVPIVGDAKRVLQSLISKTSDKPRNEWLSDISQWRSEFIIDLETGNQLLPRNCIRQIYSATQRNCYYVVDIGQNQMWAAQEFCSSKPNALITSGGLGQMGFALPAAIGVQIAKPNEMVWAIAGDGGLQMSEQELAVVIQEGLPIKIAVMNNGYLGMVRQYQERLCDGRYSATRLSGPDFVRLAGAYSIPALRVTKNNEVAKAIALAIESKGPFLLDFQVEPEANVYPCVWPGINRSNPDISSLQKEGIPMSKRVLVALVEETRPDAQEIGGILRRRGFKINSIVIGPCDKPNLLQVTAVLTTDKVGTQELRQARKQLEKSPDVVKASDVTDEGFIGQEMALISVEPPKSDIRKKALVEIMASVGAKSIKQTDNVWVFGVIGSTEEIREFILRLRRKLHFKGNHVQTGLLALQVDK